MPNNNKSRRRIVEVSSSMEKNKRVKWRVIDRRIKDNAGVEISELPLDIPRYSFKVGTVHVDKENETFNIDSRLSTFNVYDAIDLLNEAADEYTQKREEKIEEVERIKAQLQKADSE